MIGVALLSVASVASVALIPATGVLGSFARSARTARRALHIVTRLRVSEWAKERALRLVSRRLLAGALRGGWLLCIVAMPLLAIWLVDRWIPLGVRAAMADWSVRLWLFALTCTYAMLRRALAKGGGERLLQRIALSSRAVLDTSLTIERGLHPARPEDGAAAAPVFIAGLARAGTSILTRMLHDTGGFASLTYRDLPFPLAPNSWAQASGMARRHVAAQERGHGDGLMHDLDSPEAIEELFWLSQEDERYRTMRGLAPNHPLPETLVAFRDYVRLVRKRCGQPRYLSKNNNNILRLPALVEVFPDAILLHPFRDPIDQSRSLLSQHLRAIEMAEEDPYRRRFMTWLGHHEFGADHRPFLLSGDHPGVRTSHIDYWLQRWVDAYRFLLDQPEAVLRRQLFVDYEALCARPETGVADLSRRIGLDRTPDARALRPVVRRAGRRASPEVIAEAYAVHRELVFRARRGDAAVRRLSA